MAKRSQPGIKDSALVAKDLHKDYGEVLALNGLSFEVKNGEVFGLLGSNGAGKTTALKVFAGLIKPSIGEAFVLGKRVRGNEMFVKANIGYLPETPNLYETMTGYELLDLVVTLRGLDESKNEKRIMSIAKTLELDNAINQQIGTYSKGMRQKLAFAQAVIHNPKVLLLDEPTAGLDPRFAKFFKLWIRDLGSKGTTILMSTHMTLVAEQICDRIGIIAGGKIRDIGTVTELCERNGVKSIEDVFVKVVGGSAWKDLLPSSQ